MPYVTELFKLRILSLEQLKSEIEDKKNEKGIEHNIILYQS